MGELELPKDPKNVFWPKYHTSKKNDQKYFIE